MDRYISSASFNMIHLCISEHTKYSIKGEAYNNTIEQKIEFSDIQDLFLVLDKAFDMNGNPFSSEEKRSFKKEESGEMTYQNKPMTLKDYKEFKDIEGKLGTIDIVVQTRLFSNWQGKIFYQEEEDNFKDVVELIEKVEKFLNL